MPISRKVAEHIQHASWIRKMFEEGLALKARVGEANVFDFSLGNPILEPPEEFFQALQKVAADRTPGLHRYMPNAGFPEARLALAQKHSFESGLEYTPDHIVMTVGAAGAINVTLKTLLNPGEEVVLFSPYFAEYWFYVDNHGGIPRIVSTDRNFDLDLEALEKALTPKTRALLVNSPNNPSGRVYGPSSIEGLARLLEKKQREFGTTIYLITDEPYRSIVYDKIEVPIVSTYYDNTVLCTSHSKDLGLPGERIGHIAVCPKADQTTELMNGMAFTIRTLGFVNAPALMQRVVTQICDAKIDVEFYRTNRDMLYSELRSLGFECVRPEGAFYLFPKSPLQDDLSFVRKLQKHHLLTVPGSGFGSPGFFRICYAVERDILERSLPVWGQAAKEFGLRPSRESVP